ncbi:MAG: hypothetical protein JXX14_10180 [Deltaproteobacteria bacterium]|nr:hypothetical protein [Deltaproteobacteria bacterium]
MSICLRTIVFLIAIVWAASATAQYNPYARQKQKGPQPAAGSAKTEPKPAPKKKVRPKPPSAAETPRVVEEITVPKAFGDDPAQADAGTVEGKVSRFEHELEEMRLMLARAGIQEDGASLTFAQREEMGRLETKLQKLRADHMALVQAVDKGLDPALVMSNLQTLEAEMAATRDEMAQVRLASDEERASLSFTLENNEARIASLEKEVAELKQNDDGNKGDEKQVEDEELTPLERLNSLLPVEIFAFGDFMYVIQEDGPDDFAIGQLELDLTQDLITYVTITAAIAYDSEAESIGVGAFTVDGRLLGADESHLLQSKKIESLGVILGQFDVPFGIDYMEYASIDRRLVTGPIAVDATHDGWNDLGAQMYLIMPRFNAVLYGVNGFGYETVEENVAGDELVFEHPTSLAMGARLGVLPLEPLEIGGSLATFFNADAEIAQLLAGVDAALSVLDLTVKGEYIYQTQGLEADSDVSTHAMYGVALYDFQPVFVTARYSMVWPDMMPNEKQLSLGFGVQIFENGEVRFEYSTNLETGGSTAFIQLAGGSAWQPSGMRR